jgi:hypothetical protein
MAKSGLRHIDVGPELSKTEWESEETHELVHGTSFSSSPVERQLFYRDDEHKWYVYNGSEWVWLGGGMQVHGNEYHDPDFEQQGVAATLIETHRTSQTHTQPQPPAEHGNEKHSSAFATEAALSYHTSATTGVHAFDKSCLVKHSSDQTIPHNTKITLAFDTEQWDTDTIHDPSNNSRLTCKTAGLYLIKGSIRYEQNSTGFRSLLLLKGGTEVDAICVAAVNGDVTIIKLSVFLNLSVNDYVEIQGYQNSGSSLLAKSYGNQTSLAMARIA